MVRFTFSFLIWIIHFRLENALKEMACEADPSKKLKSLISDLMNFEHKTEEDLIKLTNIVDSLIDLVCQIDFALYFVRMNGLKVLEDLIVSFYCETKQF